jgi:hypothetical protein
MSFAATKRSIASLALLVLVGWVSQVQAQFGVGTTWVRTDAAAKGLTMSVEACCNGGLRLIYQVAAVAGQPATTMTVDSPMDGKEVPVVVAGKPSGQTMAITRVDDRHYTSVSKANGQLFGTSSATVSADGKSMTVESVTLGTKTIETWVRK